MPSEVCSKCHEEVRYGAVPGGTAWVHRPGSPGDRDGHWAVLGVMGPYSPDLYRRKEEPDEEADQAPVEEEESNDLRIVVEAHEVRPDDMPPDANSPRQTVTKLHNNGIATSIWLAVAVRGDDRTIASIGIAALNPANGSRVAAMWLHDDGLKDAAWKFKSCIAYGPGRHTVRLGFSQIVPWLTTR